ncbi:unnamed protein product, partial [Didymodactylos carnosus]
MLVIDGFEFQSKNSAKTIEIWRCANRDCGVILHTNIHDEFLRYSGKGTEHCHLPSTVRVEVRNVKQLMQERARNDLAPLQQIVEQEVRKALLTAEALALLASLPVVYALLSDRFASTYVYLINVLFTEAAPLNKKFEPSLIMSDFEPALAKAIMLEVQSPGLSSTYLDNVMICSTVRQMMALALVPEQFVPSLFPHIGEDLDDPDRDELSDLFKYFDGYWMRQIPIWNVSSLCQRTNNTCE